MVTTPLRYPGGKAKLFPFFAELISRNNLYSHEYCEPYAGGAGLAIKLLSRGFVPAVHLNDLDVTLWALWTCVLRHPTELCSLIRHTPVTIEEWRKQKAIWRAADADDVIALGFATLFLNRTNRSGIIDGGGPIGGIGQNGEWKLDVRFPKDRQIANIMSLSRFAPQITLSKDDAAELVRHRLEEDNVLIYLDPPYYHKSRKLYKNFYKHSDHAGIAELLLQHRSARWVLTYDNAPEIEVLYAGITPIYYDLFYTAGPKMAGTEVMFLSDTIQVPDMEPQPGRFRRAA